MSDWREAKEAREAEQGYRESTMREVRLRDWFSNRDNPDTDLEFARLVKNIKQMNSRKNALAAGGETASAWMERERASNRKIQLLARREAWRRTRENPVIQECPICGARWCILPILHPGNWTWCSTECRVQSYQPQRREQHRARRMLELRQCQECDASYCPVPWISTGRYPATCSTECHTKRKRWKGRDQARRARANNKRSDGKKIVTCGGPNCSAQWSIMPRAIGGRAAKYCSKSCKMKAWRENKTNPNPEEPTP